MDHSHRVHQVLPILNMEEGIHQQPARLQGGLKAAAEVGAATASASPPPPATDNKLDFRAGGHQCCKGTNDSFLPNSYKCNIQVTDSTLFLVSSVAIAVCLASMWWLQNSPKRQWPC